MERHLTGCSEWGKNIYLGNLNQVQKNLFHKLVSFGFKYTSEQKLIETFAIFDTESICVPEETFKDTKTTTWIGELDKISLSNSSNLVKKPTFFCKSDRHHLVSSFIEVVEVPALQGKAPMKPLTFDIETTRMIRMGNVL